MPTTDLTARIAPYLEELFENDYAGRRGGRLLALLAGAAIGADGSPS